MSSAGSGALTLLMVENLSEAQSSLNSPEPRLSDRRIELILDDIVSIRSYRSEIEENGESMRGSIDGEEGSIDGDWAIKLCPEGDNGSLACTLGDTFGR